MHIHCILATKGGEITSIAPEATALAAAEQMAGHGIGSLLVLDDDGGVAGIVAERDLVRAVTVLRDLREITVADVMDRDVVTCTRNDTIESVVRTMTERRIRHVPVLDDDGALCGIVSIGDVVKHRLDELTAEAAAMHDYIAIGR